jgi:hypothetical protein
MSLENRVIVITGGARAPSGCRFRWLSSSRPQTGGRETPRSHSFLTHDFRSGGSPGHFAGERSVMAGSAA